MRSLALALALLFAQADAALLAQESPKEAEIIVVHPAAGTGSKQGIPLFQGISGQNAGTQHISMNKVVIPSGDAAKAHIHKGYELVVYLIKGRVKTLYGEGLKKSVINEAGDFLYIPADLPHKPVNLSDTEAAEAIVARTDPTSRRAWRRSRSPRAAAEKEVSAARRALRVTCAALRGAPTLRRPNARRQHAREDQRRSEKGHEGRRQGPRRDAAPRQRGDQVGRHRRAPSARTRSATPTSLACWQR